MPSQRTGCGPWSSVVTLSPTFRLSTGTSPPGVRISVPRAKQIGPPTPGVGVVPSIRLPWESRWIGVPLGRPDVMVSEPTRFVPGKPAGKGETWADRRS